ncbi:MAG: hypothetical protein AB3N13_09225 [Arenibacterium sp.]
MNEVEPAWRSEQKAIDAVLDNLAATCRMVFITGLPASGKSFLLRKLMIAAGEKGRRVHLLRWDTGLSAFETPETLKLFPQVDSGSHPVIRKAAGIWGRRAIRKWEVEHTDPGDILIGEVPIIGNRFSEFVQVLEDETESLLSSDMTQFVYPIPSNALRDRLEARRRETFASPGHPDEAKDAPPSTMDYA